MRVVNQSRLDFKYRLHPTGPIIAKTIFSNEVITSIIQQMLVVTKQVDKLETTIFEVLTYTITITNMSQIVVSEVFFKDITPEGTRIIVNSVQINGVKKRCVNPNYGFVIGAIDPGKSIVICFKVVVLPEYTPVNIYNHSEIIYDYIYNVEMPPQKLTLYTNIVDTLIENKLFKQFNISNTLELKSCLDSIQSIEDIDVKINIINTKLVATAIAKTNNHCELDLYKLIIIGTIEYNLIYKNKCHGYSKMGTEKLTDVEGFSCFILVPYGIQYCNHTKVKAHIENISSCILNERSIFIDVSVLTKIGAY